jgi:hypothetical protein
MATRRDRKDEERFWFRYFRLSDPTKAPEYLEWFGAPDCEYTDEDIDFLTRRTKRIDVLILGGSNVTAACIPFIARLSFITRLDLKDQNLTDDCIPDLLKLQTLEHLHLGHNNISPEGIKKLVALDNLQTLIFSVHTLITPSIEKEFKDAFPNCELTICGRYGSDSE